MHGRNVASFLALLVAGGELKIDLAGRDRPRDPRRAGRGGRPSSGARGPRPPAPSPPRRAIAAAGAPVGTAIASNGWGARVLVPPGGAGWRFAGKRNGWRCPWQSPPRPRSGRVWAGRHRATSDSGSSGRRASGRRPRRRARPTTSPSTNWTRPLPGSRGEGRLGGPRPRTSTSSARQDPDLYQRYQLGLPARAGQDRARRARGRARVAGAVPGRGPSLPGPRAVLRGRRPPRPRARRTRRRGCGNRWSSNTRRATHRQSALEELTALPHRKGRSPALADLAAKVSGTVEPSVLRDLESRVIAARAAKGDEGAIPDGLRFLRGGSLADDAAERVASALDRPEWLDKLSAEDLVLIGESGPQRAPLRSRRRRSSGAPCPSFRPSGTTSSSRSAAPTSDASTTRTPRRRLRRGRAGGPRRRDEGQLPVQRVAVRPAPGRRRARGALPHERHRARRQDDARLVRADPAPAHPRPASAGSRRRRPTSARCRSASRRAMPSSRPRSPTRSAPSAGASRTLALRELERIKPRLLEKKDVPEIDYWKARAVERAIRGRPRRVYLRCCAPTSPTHFAFFARHRMAEEPLGSRVRARRRPPARRRSSASWPPETGRRAAGPDGHRAAVSSRTRSPRSWPGWPRSTAAAGTYRERARAARARVSALPALRGGGGGDAGPSRPAARDGALRRRHRPHPGALSAAAAASGVARAEALRRGRRRAPVDLRGGSGRARRHPGRLPAAAPAAAGPRAALPAVLLRRDHGGVAEARGRSAPRAVRSCARSRGSTRVRSRRRPPAACSSSSSPPRGDVGQAIGLVQGRAGGPLRSASS